MLKRTYLVQYYGTVINNPVTGASIMAYNPQLFKLLRIKENY